MAFGDQNRNGLPTKKTENTLFLLQLSLYCRKGFSIFKTKNLNFYISDNFLHSNALGECFKISKRNPGHSECRNPTYLKEVEKVFKYWVTQKSGIIIML